MTVSRTGTTPTPFGFVGKGQYQTDNDSGLMLLGHRYYDASVGRFISSDPAKSGNNWYAYCDNHPLSGIDPSGYSVSNLGWGVGIIAGGTILASGGTAAVAIGVAFLIGAASSYLETIHDHPNPSPGVNPYKNALDTGLMAAATLLPVQTDGPSGLPGSQSPGAYDPGLYSSGRPDCRQLAEELAPVIGGTPVRIMPPIDQPLYPPDGMVNPPVINDPIGPWTDHWAISKGGPEGTMHDPSLPSFEPGLSRSDYRAKFSRNRTIYFGDEPFE